MLNWKIWTTVAAIFLAGTIVGVTGTGLFIKYHFAPPPDRESFRAEMAERITDRLRQGLGLTEQATGPVRDEVESSLEALQTVHESMQPKAEAIIADGIRRVKSHLTKTQQAELNRMIEDSRSRKFNLFHLPPPPPPFP